MVQQQHHHNHHSLSMHTQHVTPSDAAMVVSNPSLATINQLSNHLSQQLHLSNGGCSGRNSSLGLSGSVNSGSPNHSISSLGSNHNGDGNHHHHHRGRHTVNAGNNSHFASHSHFISSISSQISHLNLSSSASTSSACSSVSSTSSPVANVAPNLAIPYHHSYVSNSGTNNLHPGNNNHSIHSSQSQNHNPHHQQAQNHLAQQPSHQPQNSSRYKTELCRPFEENGTCKYGEKCQFAHGLAELRTLARHPKYKTEFCRTFHTTGFCPYGPRCHFIHNSKNTTTQQSLSGLGAYGPFSSDSVSTSPSTSPISSIASSSATNNSLGTLHSSAALMASSSSSAASSASSTSSVSSSTFPTSISPSSGRVIMCRSSSRHSPSSNHPCSPDQHSPSNSYDALSQLSGCEANCTSGGFSCNNKSCCNRSRSSPANTIDDSDQHRHHSAQFSEAARRNESEDVAHPAGCASETQKLFWLHSHMSEGSRWTPAICASGLISSRRTWQMQA